MSIHADHVLAIDSGTTGTTTMVLDPEGHILASGYAEMPQIYPRPGWVEHDPDEIWKATMVSVAQALARSGVSGERIGPVGITNQRETTLVWDRATGRPVHNAIVWQCRRTTEMCQDLRARGYQDLFARKTGLVLDPYFSGTKIAWILDQDVTLRERAERGDLAFGTVDTWLLWHLTAGESHRTDATNASRTLLYDIHRRQWDEQLCKILRVPLKLLPQVLPPAAEFGPVKNLPGVGSGARVRGMAGDQQAALYGQTCFDAGESKNTYGTGCFLLMNTGAKAVRSRRGLVTTLAADATGGVAYALEGSVFIAGAAVQWLRDGLGLVAHASQTQDLARSVPDSAGVHFVPAFAGLGAPYWDPDARGALLGLTRGTTRAHVVRSALEAMAFQTQEVLECMQADSGIRTTTLRVDGGAAANDFLMQFQADISQVPVDRPVHLESTALGAAYLAGVQAGLWTPKQLREIRQTEHLFKPNREAAEAARAVAEWKASVARVLTKAPVAPKRPSKASAGGKAAPKAKASSKARSTSVKAPKSGASKVKPAARKQAKKASRKPTAISKRRAAPAHRSARPAGRRRA